MAQTARKELKVNQLVDQYLKRSKELDNRLEDIKSEVDAHNQRVQKRQLLEDKLVELADLITDAESSVDGLRERYHDASFRQDEDTLTAIQHQRASKLADIEQYKQDIADTKAELDSVVIDGVAIAELAATLEAGIRTPDYREFLKVLEEDCKARATEQDKRLKELRSTVPSQYKSQQAYDLAMKQLDSSYRTSDEVKQAAQRRQAAREEERRRFDQHKPKSSEEIRKQKDSAFVAATKAPVTAHQW